MVAGSYTALREKKIGDSLSDSKIDIEIKKKLYAIDPKLYSDVSVVTDHGCVLLTGGVSNPDWSSAAEREAWKVDGVLEVNNHIYNEEVQLSQIVRDDFITSVCRSALICNSDIRSVNYKIKTFGSVVYLLGVARTKEELELVLSTVQKVSGVEKVVSYIKVL